MRQSNGEQLAFIDLFENKNLSVQIPIIQRDYAQGRSSTKKVRDNFLEVLCDHLISKSPLNLDFVYGRLLKGRNNGDYKFIPLDGQQRLTTLFLLHWYLAVKNGNFEEFKAVAADQYGSKFSYETRISSGEFCDAIMSIDASFINRINDPSNVESVSDLIKNESWFFLSWKHDPTISGMLTMLDAIDQRLINEEVEFSLLSEKKLFTFNFLNLDDFKLTDDLYIKMNARGKSLTSFENYKAKLQQFLEETHPELEKEFTAKIDSIWVDLFWDFSKNAGEEYVTADDLLLNFFEYVTQMLYYKRKEDLMEMDIVEAIPIVFDDPENVSFLFHSLNIFIGPPSENQFERIQAYFESLFSATYEKGMVCYFDSEFDLFYNCINKKNFDHKEKLLFFAILYYHFKTSSEGLTASENLMDYLRICRNFVIRINQRIKHQFQPELRESDYNYILSNIIEIFDPESCYSTLEGKDFSYRKGNVQFEKEKAKIIREGGRLIKDEVHRLEDHPYLRGAIHNFMDIFNDANNLTSFVNTVYEVWPKINDGLIIRSLLTIKSYYPWVGYSHHFGHLYFLGKGKDWYRILTERYEKEDDAERAQDRKMLFSTFIRLVHGRDKTKPLENFLEQRIITELNKIEKKNWKYYFIKYPNITDSEYNIFAFKIEDDKEKVEYVNGTTLRSRHIGAFIKAVLGHAELKKDHLDLSEIWQANYPESKIRLNSGIALVQHFSSWVLEIPKDYKIKKLRRKFQLEKGHFSEDDPRKKMPVDCYFLDATKDRDLVEIAVDVINYLKDEK